jgi:hypothetical protein
MRSPYRKEGDIWEPLQAMGKRFYPKLLEGVFAIREGGIRI